MPIRESSDHHHDGLGYTGKHMGNSIMGGLPPISQPIPSWNPDFGLPYNPAFGANMTTPYLNGLFVHQDQASAQLQMEAAQRDAYMGNFDANAAWYQSALAPLEARAASLFNGGAQGGASGNGTSGAPTGDGGKGKSKVGNTLAGVAGGAALGTAIGLAGGPFAPISVPVGAGVGAVVGGLIGFFS